MVCASQTPLLIAVVFFVIFQKINGTLSGSDLCSAKFDSEYEDACLRGYRMKEEAEKHSFKGLSGVTCENSCSDLYKNEAKLINSCKYGCDIKISVVAGDSIGGVLDHLRRKMMNHLKIFENLFGGQQTLTPDNTETQNQKSEVKTSGTVRVIRIFFPLGHPEHPIDQNAAQTFVDSESPLDKIRRVMGLPPLSDPHSNDQTVDDNNQQVLHHSFEYPFGTLDSDTNIHPISNEEDNMTSFVDKFAIFVRSLSSTTYILMFFIAVVVTFFLIKLSNCVYRRCTHRTYSYSSLPVDVEEIKSHYPVGLEEKTNGDVKAAGPKDAKEALGV